MAYYFLFPEIDSTIYSHPERKLLNAGGDEILEIVKEKHTDQKYYPTRILVKFKNEEIKNVIQDTIGSSTFNNGTSEVSLKLYETEQKNLINLINLDVFAVSQSWQEGKGRYSNLPTSSNGVSWIYRDNETNQTQWPTGSVTGLTFGSASIRIDEFPSSSAHKLIIGDKSYIPVLSASSFFSGSDSTEIYVETSASNAEYGSTYSKSPIANFNKSLVTAINTYSTDVSASMIGTGWPSVGILILSGSVTGSKGNVKVYTSSIAGNNPNTQYGHQPLFGNTHGSDSDVTDKFSLQGGTDGTAVTFYPGTTGSLDEDLLTAGGGTWWTGSNYSSTQQFLNADSFDTDFSVLQIVQRWSSSLFASQTYNQGNLPSGIENHGFIIKQPESVELNASHSFGELQYFSVNTHTIYPPKLCFKWDDSTHEYTSQAKTSGELNVSLYKNQEEYNQNDIAKFRVHVRDKYPTRTFATSSNYLNVGYFTANSFYSVRDAHSEEEIIPFDDTFTKMSADEEGMYFNIYMKGLQPERYYRLLFKHKNDDGTIIYDNDYIFKVIR